MGAFALLVVLVPAAVEGEAEERSEVEVEDGGLEETADEGFWLAATVEGEAAAGVVAEEADGVEGRGDAVVADVRFGGIVVNAGGRRGEWVVSGMLVRVGGRAGACVIVVAGVAAFADDSTGLEDVCGCTAKGRRGGKLV